MYDIAAVMIGQYTRNKAPSTGLRADTSRMCVLFNGEYGNIMPTMLFSGLAGDMMAQDQVWNYMYNTTMCLDDWQAKTSITLQNITNFLATSMGPDSMGSWLSMINISYCPICDTSVSSNVQNISLWPTSSPVLSKPTLCNYL